MNITNETLQKIVTLLGTVGVSQSKFSDDAMAVLSFVTNEIVANNSRNLDYNDPQNNNDKGVS